MFYKICIIILIIGGLNWGLVGVLNFDLVAFLFSGSASLLSRIVYTLIGIVAICSVPAIFTENSHATRDDHGTPTV